MWVFILTPSKLGKQVNWILFQLKRAPKAIYVMQSGAWLPIRDASSCKVLSCAMSAHSSMISASSSAITATSSRVFTIAIASSRNCLETFSAAIWFLGYFIKGYRSGYWWGLFPQLGFVFLSLWQFFQFLDCKTSLLHDQT